jgi:excisionase family DNA binding protein
MGKRHPNPLLVKINRSYTVEEAAHRLGVHKNTVREWIKRGLPVINDKRPMLILGRDLFEYLQARRVKNKRPCKLNQMYCLRCRVPKTPADNMVDYEPKTETLGNLYGICPDCGAGMNRRTSMAKLEQIRGKMDITFPQGLRRLVDSCYSSVNSDFR